MAALVYRLRARVFSLGSIGPTGSRVPGGWRTRMEIRDLLFHLIGVAFGITLLVVYGVSAAWLVNDAQKRGCSGIAPFVLLRFLGPFSVIIWLFVRPRTKLVERPVHDYANADDALDAASKLDMLGDWDEAIALYQYAAERWPEHGSYIKACIKVINGKKGGIES